MRRGKKRQFRRVAYTYIEPAAEARLREQGIAIDLQEANGISIAWVSYPMSMKWESGGRNRLGVQLYDQSTLVTVYTLSGPRLYVTRPADPLHRPSFDDLLAAKE